jgi:hypothetical protein
MSALEQLYVQDLDQMRSAKCVPTCPHPVNGITDRYILDFDSCVVVHPMPAEMRDDAPIGHNWIAILYQPVFSDGYDTNTFSGETPNLALKSAELYFHSRLKMVAGHCKELNSPALVD